MIKFPLGFGLVSLTFLAACSSAKPMPVASLSCETCMASEELRESSWELGEIKTCRTSDDIDRGTFGFAAGTVKTDPSAKNREVVLLCDKAPSIMIQAVGLEAFEYYKPRPPYAASAKSQAAGLRSFINGHTRVFRVSFRGVGQRERRHDAGFDTSWACTKDSSSLTCK